MRQSYWYKNISVVFCLLALHMLYSQVPKKVTSICGHRQKNNSRIFLTRCSLFCISWKIKINVPFEIWGETFSNMHSFYVRLLGGGGSSSEKYYMKIILIVEKILNIFFIWYVQIPLKGRCTNGSCVGCIQGNTYGWIFPYATWKGLQGNRLSWYMSVQSTRKY